MSKYKMVPVEPTAQMLQAGQEAWLKDPLQRSSTLYKAMLAAAPAVQGDPVVWSLRFRYGDKYERVGLVNYMTTFGSKEDADIYANRVARDLDGNPEPERRPDVVPLYTAPQPAPDTALVEAFDAGRRAEQADVAQLVEALEEIAQWVGRWASADHPVATVARKALAAHRKGGDA